MITSLLVPALLSITPNVETPQAFHMSGPVEAAAQHQVDVGIYNMPQPVALGGGLTILETAAAAGNFTTLAAALNAANLTTTLEGPGPFTVFAPTDAAFGNVGPRRLEFLLDPNNIDFLTELLTFHVVSGNVDATQVLGSTFLTTLANQRADIDAGAVQIEGANITTTDIVCTNGIIHIIDDVIFPELRTITGLTASTPDFSTLFFALETAGLDDDLETAGPFTVFAPTNAAFDLLPAGVLDSLVANPTALGDVLLYHVTPGQLYAEDVLASSTLPMLNMINTNIAIVNGNPQINDSIITVTDVETRNGIVHIIDAVLVPGP